MRTTRTYWRDEELEVVDQDEAIHWSEYVRDLCTYCGHAGHERKTCPTAPPYGEGAV